jgi:hypothetical protein
MFEPPYNFLPRCPIPSPFSLDFHEVDPQIQQLYLAFQGYSIKPARKKRRQNTARRMGFTLSHNTFDSLPVVKLSRLVEPYPPFNNIVLERSQPIPQPLKEKDGTCKHPAKFHVLDESQLVHTVAADESVVIVDDQTNEIVAVVIRSFAKTSFPIIRKWADKLIRDTVRRRTTSQRNGKGILVLFGTSTGPRNNRIVGWVRNLAKNRWSKSPDRNEHDTELSSLFGLFYSLVKTQLSPEIVGDFERSIEGSNLPRIDFHGNSEFTLPFDPPLRFSAYTMAPPEGYVAIDYVKEIHDDKHFKGCPWGIYWNIVRKQPHNRIGIKSGANFFVADYGLRIANSENVCVAWNISMKHGTSWYYDDLSHAGLTFILGRDLESTWNRYEQGLKGPTRFKDGLLVVDASDSEHEE